jgi:hypothetical protein
LGPRASAEASSPAIGLEVAELRYSGREKRTGIKVPPEYFAVVNELRNGSMVAGREYATRKEALEAAGLRE